MSQTIAMPDLPSSANARKEASRQKSAFSLPSITLPKGGGAIHGMGEKLSANPATGSASLSIPIFATPSRADFYPKLSLSYDSASGNGPFGFGWALSAPAITRKTDKGLPKYRDYENSDVFILSGAEDLVPAFQLSGSNWIADTYTASSGGASFAVQRYRPRVEAPFLRIERWRDEATGDTHWRAISKENVTSVYGTTSQSRISDPDDPSRIFSWLLDNTYDDRGNTAVYQYKPEDSTNVPSTAHEQNRVVTANRYIKRILYGNTTPYYPADGSSLPSTWYFELVFDYGEHDVTTPTPDEIAPWICRPDPFSSYRPTFEVRTYRICRRVLMFHHIEAELGQPSYLVRSTDFSYSIDQQPANPLNALYTFLQSVKQTGYVKAAAGAGYNTAEFPAVEFEYTQVNVNQEVQTADPETLANIPADVDGTRYQWVDLDSEGSPGILTEQANGWFYKRNVSAVSDTVPVMAQFEPLQLVADRPSLAAIGADGQRLMDLAGDGHLYLVQFNAPNAGYYERDPEGYWKPFTEFAFQPGVNWNEPNLRFIDLDGDGHADVLITEDAALTWFPSLARDGFGPPCTASKPFDEERGPAVVFADGTQSIYTADFSGDGLTDIVRIRNGEICYWPNLGYGRFGAKITMDGAPVFDTPELFDHRRIRLADIDGSGTTDIVYLGAGAARFWFNQCGNSWGAPIELEEFPQYTNVDSVNVLDLLGSGTACIVWSSPLPGDALRQLRYIDVLGGQKPHLLVSVQNNLGAETRVQYAPSTKFYLKDRAAGHPWVTNLPFPVQVVERVEHHEYITQTDLVSVYAYHHGYFDGVEREFRGFGMVEQWDTEAFSKYSGAGVFTSTPQVDGDEFDLPPIHTKTWFHTGAYFDLESISQYFSQEFYQGDVSAAALPDPILPTGLTGDETREACRALAGKVLRHEVYADDNTPQSSQPYSVAANTFCVTCIQPRLGNPYASFYAYETEGLSYHYERNPADPRIAHLLTLEVDAYGNVRKSASVAYPRRNPLFPEQAQIHISYSESDLGNLVDQPTYYRTGLPFETRTYELILIPHTGALYTPSELLSGAAGATEISYETSPGAAGMQKRLIERVRTLYLKNDLSAALPLGQVESLALPFEAYKLAFTPGLLAIYGSKIAAAQLAGLLTGEGKYQDLDADGQYWVTSGRPLLSPNATAPDPVFARNHFYLPQGAQDAFGNISHVTMDAYDLLPIETEDAVQNTVSSKNDYRVMQAALITDANGNRGAVAFDALGTVIATAVMGKEGASDGDTLADPTTRIEYDLFQWANSQKPMYLHTFAREQHGAANAGWQESYSYLDGTGREVLRKVQAAPGLAPARDQNGVLQHDASGKLIFATTNTRWIGSGRVILDNKGNSVKAYEPYFDSTPAYEDEKELAEWGVTSIVRYDPLNRPVRTDVPNGTFSSSEFDAWQQTNFDENDTVLQSIWYSNLGSPDPNGPEPSDPQVKAAWLAAKHANTPTTAHFDSLKRAFLVISDNGPAGKYQARTQIDIQGNVRAVADPLNRQIATYDYDVLNRRIHQTSADNGERWMLNDVENKPMRGWDSRGNQLRHQYDALKRPQNLYVQGTSGPERLAESIVYGEGQTNDLQLNLRGKAFKQLDGAGAVTNSQYDFKGNLVASSRQLLSDYANDVDWSASPALDAQSYGIAVTYDALNRPVTITTADSSIIHPTYNNTNLLDQVAISIRGAATATTFVSGIDYNARGQREQVQYGASVAKSTYSYDPNSFRLIGSQTVRNADNVLLRDLSYIYDPIGNVTQNNDQAQQTTFFNNQVIAPVFQYTYDAVYRLTGATGRELILPQAQSQTTYDDSPRMGQALPSDGSAMRNYSEAYQYDSAGNLSTLVHTAANGNWTRTYAYDEPNAVPTNNRLTSTTVGVNKESYTYDAHGNITQMSHLPTMQWDFKDQLQMVQQQVVNNAPAGKIYYVYDAGGRRVRKVNQLANGSKGSERIYLGGFEIYREYGSDGTVTLERETLHVMDDTRRIALIDTKTIDTSVPTASLPSTLTRYQFDNHIASAWLELDDGAAIISYEEYFPYGSTSYQSGRNAAEVSLKRYRYAGKERDESTGFSYHGARYYAPWLGRWISCDPAGMLDGMNLYSFTRNNPLNLTDPSGTSSDRYEELPGPVLDVLSRIGIPSGDGDSGGGSSILDDIGNALSAAWDWIKGAASTAWSWVKGAAATVWDWTKQAASAVWNWTKGAATAAWNWTKSAVSSAWNWIKGAASTVWNWVTGAATAAWNWTKNAAVAAWNWTKGAASTAWEWTKQAASAAWSWTKQAASTAWSAIKTAAAWTWNWILAPLIRTATNAAAGAAIGFAIGGVGGAIGGAIAGAVTGGIHAWQMAAAHTYDWSSLAGWGMFLADNTWSLPNSVVGSIWATLNIWNPVDKSLSQGTGELVFKHGWASSYSTTFGNVTAGTIVPHHERTHGLQARIFGPLFYPLMLAHYAINIVAPFWLIYHDARYPGKPITTFGQYFSRGVYPHTWAEEWAYSVEGSPQ